MTHRRRLGLAAFALALATGLAGVAEAQVLGQGPAPGVSAWRVVAALVLCLVLAVAGAVALKSRLGARAPKVWPLQGLNLWRWRTAARGGRRVEALESIRLSPQVEVCLFNCDGRAFLAVATTQGGLQVVDLDANTPLKAPQ
ncbi:MAG: Flagellar biosynthesis protein FliO [Caulobacteraceae bacterium]|nr:Flagellar biosynthesis protein FliO [Caulobacteraceae bacterium]